MKIFDYCYHCPICNENLIISEQLSNLYCENNHHFPLDKINEKMVPVFCSETFNANEYNIVKAAEIHDNSLNWLFKTFNTTEENLRESLISRLNLKEGFKVLITGAGAGNDLPYIAKQIGNSGKIYAQDFSFPMLKSAIQRIDTIYALNNCDINFSVSDATNLPFIDNYFDAVFHFGGINLFSDIGKGIREMDRVAKSNGMVVFGDEGVAPWLKETEYGKMIINNNPICNFDAPLNFIPSTARDVSLTWEVGNYFYVISFKSSSTPLPLNIDVPHLGKRGGTIRTRYFGVLEGINPDLKKIIYENAENYNISRVDYIERIIKDGIDVNNGEINV